MVEGGKMKLIIEISEEDFKWLDYQSVSMPILQVIKNGIPLDDIMTHLQTMADDEWNQQVGASKGLEEAIEIIESFTERSNDAT